MNPQRIEFLAHRREISREPIPNAYRFSPRGRMAFLQNLAWIFLGKTRALEVATEEHVTVTSHVIDAGNFIQRLFQMTEAMHDLRFVPKRILIGSEDYAELMESPEVRRQGFAFQAELHEHKRMFGLTVQVVPWMRGVLVMP